MPKYTIEVEAMMLHSEVREIEAETENEAVDELFTVMYDEGEYDDIEIVSIKKKGE